jgi:hypothetical protein
MDEDDFIKMYESQPIYFDTPEGKKKVGYIKSVRIDDNHVIGKFVITDEEIDKLLD